MTPPPVVEERAAVWRPFLDEEISWRSDEVRELAAAVAELDPDAVDVHGAFVRRSDYRDLFPDGVHPTLEGQTVILTTLVGVLSSARGPAAPSSWSHPDLTAHIADPP
jgi:lysophospholipase L1-like esterase